MVDLVQTPVDAILQARDRTKSPPDHVDVVGGAHGAAGERVRTAVVAAKQRGEKRQPDKATSNE